MSAIVSVLRLCKAVADQARRAKSNRQRAQRLGDRVTHVSDALSQLQGVALDASLARQVTAVEKVLNDANAFLEQLSDSSWAVRLLKAGDHCNHFDDIHMQLSQAMEGFHFARDIQQLLLDRQEDVEDDEMDLPELTTQLGAVEKELRDKGPSAASDLEKLRAQKDAVQRRLLMSQAERKRTEDEQSKWELNPSQLRVDESAVLGQGASAIVYRGELNFEPVAVKVRAVAAAARHIQKVWVGRERPEDAPVLAKVFKARITPEQRSSLLKEVSLMGSGAHSSLVSVRCERSARPHFSISSLQTCNYNSAQWCLAVQGLRLYRDGASRHGPLHGVKRCTRSMTTRVSISLPDAQALHGSGQQIKLSLLDKLQICEDVARGLVALHNRTKPVWHRDLKSLNVLLQTSHGVIRGKIGDFGLAVPMSGGLASYVTSTTVGTTAYMAPELLQAGRGLQVSASMDIYALALVFWEIFAEEVPWSGIRARQIISSVLAGERPALPQLVPLSAPDPLAAGAAGHCPTEYGALIERLWAQNRQERPDAGETCRLVIEINACWRARLGVPQSPLHRSVPSQSAAFKIETPHQEVLANHASTGASTSVPGPAYSAAAAANGVVLLGPSLRAGPDAAVQLGSMRPKAATAMESMQPGLDVN
jgi:serine/threonine protein kinase